MNSISVYANHKASRSSNEQWESVITDFLHSFNIAFNSPKTLAELELTFRREVENPSDIMIVIGGDGSVNAVLQNIMTKNLTPGLLVIPAGTANDLASELGNSSEYLNELLASVKSERSKLIDVIKINDTYMATNGGMGLGARVAGQVNSLRDKVPFFKKLMKNTRGHLYSIVALIQALKKTPSYHLKFSGENINTTVMTPLVLVNNQPTIANKYVVAPHTHNNDGRFNLCIFTHKNKFSLFKAIASIILGRYPTHDPNLISIETSDVLIENLNPKLKPDFFGDGEVFPHAENQTWHITSLHQSLKVYTQGTNLCDQTLKAPHHS